jgi:hypothetical protein
LCGDLAAKRGWVDVVDERALAVDLDDRQPLPVPRFELRIPTDVDLLEVEGHLTANFLDDRPGTLAEVAALRVVERDPRYG